MAPFLGSRASEVAVVRAEGGYDATAPFSPGAAYPEYPFDDAGRAPGANHVYAAVREALRRLELDLEHYGQSNWNPLVSIARPGQTVVLKPNFVREFRDTRDGHEDCLVTHGAVIRAVADYVYLALRGEGRLIIADAPHSDCDFEAVMRITQTRAIVEFYRAKAGFNIELYDLRPEVARKIDGVIVGHEPLPGDPEGYVKVDLGRRSMFAEVEDLCHLLYGSEYDTSELCRHHMGGRHEYLISRTTLHADCVLSLPKLKTHKKTGLTVNMKNLVGINGNKNWLPHHREGTPSQGGDQFKDDAAVNKLERSTVARFKKVFPYLGPLRLWIAGPIKAVGKKLFGDTSVDKIRSGNWHGNDTTWRMVIDLNRILMYADAEGRLHDDPVRSFFSVVDGITAGEGNGPMDPTPKAAGVILAGFNPLAVDLACARLMGFDYRKLPVLHRSLDAHPLPMVDFTYADVQCHSNDAAFEGRLTDFRGPTLNFKPHFGWVGHVEVEEEVHEAGALA